MQLTDLYKIRKNTVGIDLCMNGAEKMISHTYFPQMAEENVGGFEKINEFYRKDALERNVYAIQQVLMPAAEDSIEYADEERNRYQWESDYNITCNKAPLLSLYTDSYQYTGGAHGLTVRKSQSWNCNDGRQIKLAEFFPGAGNYEAIIKNEIIRQIEAKGMGNKELYFDNYKELINQNFKPENYYIEGNILAIVVYFQQYEIAPYATGIPEFKIPLKAAR
ncbi:DUF3298 and DUF4163 domain-containing protein [Tyzzerella sp. OttesenSCG-928-J15]|nr:DUF3298 and DUF4163 domain-containing protein [Tyzzerella sp. OttesenSCG-928-J15]